MTRDTHTSHGLNWWDPQCVDCVHESWQDALGRANTLADGMLSLLQQDHPSIREADEHCAILWQWLDIVCEKVAQERADGHDPRDAFATIADNASAIRTAIQKSSYLQRRLYEGEEHRTKPCPKHQGEWSGLPHPDHPCPHGCGLTGWLPAETRIPDRSDT